ncbi:hypothetical protein SDC9_196076 [bioreactor metagenome]|uniref:Uncharacterized protein n=1 Tax=bioreactor metagenome TaxID=1076179 RepID=A0A645IDD7_9ZZZZ
MRQRIRRVFLVLAYRQQRLILAEKRPLDVIQHCDARTRGTVIQAYDVSIRYMRRYDLLPPVKPLDRLQSVAQVCRPLIVERFGRVLHLCAKRRRQLIAASRKHHTRFFHQRPVLLPGYAALADADAAPEVPS